MRSQLGFLAAAVAVAGVMLCADSAKSLRAASVQLDRIASGLDDPIYLGAPVGDTARLFIAEQHTGQIKIFNTATGQFNETPFLDLSGLASGGEQGLLGVAFHPDFATNGRFYVDVTVQSGATEIREYTVGDNPDIANPDSKRVLLGYEHPGASNHNGGWMDFSPNNGYLYIATGDGGSGNDPNNHAQDVTDQRLGKLLRIDVNGTNGPNGQYGIPESNPFVGVEGDDEIWAYGLRNPWRNSFDRETGDLLIADVGQDAREEIDFEPADFAGGANYGWKVMEGTFCANPQATLPCDDPSFTTPIHEYSHESAPDGGFAVTGGYVYRGAAMPFLDGAYLFGDYVTDQIWSFRYDGATKTDFVNLRSQMLVTEGTLNQTTSFGQGADGELYVVTLHGDIFKLVPLWGDTNGDGRVDLVDLNNVRNNFGGSGLGDTDFDNDVDLTDLNNVRNDFGGSAVAAVPEPSSLVILAFGLGAAGVRWRGERNFFPRRSFQRCRG